MMEPLSPRFLVRTVDSITEYTKDRRGFYLIVEFMFFLKTQMHGSSMVIHAISDEKRSGVVLQSV